MLPMALLPPSPRGHPCLARPRRRSRRRLPLGFQMVFPPSPTANRLPPEARFERHPRRVLNTRCRTRLWLALTPSDRPDNRNDISIPHRAVILLTHAAALTCASFLPLDPSARRRPPGTAAWKCNYSFIASVIDHFARRFFHIAPLPGPPAGDRHGGLQRTLLPRGRRAHTAQP